MALVSLAAYGAQHGVSKQAAAKWKARGPLVIRDDKVDVERSDQRMLGAGAGRFKGGGSTHDNRQPVVPPVVALDVVQAADVLTDELDALPQLEAFIERLLGGGYSSLLEAQTVKENALALIRVLEARRKSGALVELQVAKAAMFEAGRQMRDAWLGFPSRVAPLMAADLSAEVDPVREALSLHVNQQLADLGEPNADFGEDGGAAA